MTNHKPRSLKRQFLSTISSALFAALATLPFELPAEPAADKEPERLSSASNKLISPSEKPDYSSLNTVESLLKKVLNDNNTLNQRLTTAKLKNSHDLEPLEQMSKLVEKFALQDTPISKLKNDFVKINALHQSGEAETAKTQLIELGEKLHTIDETVSLIEQSVDADLRAIQSQKDSKMYFMMRMKTKVPPKAQRAYGLMEIARNKRDQGNFKEAFALWEKSETMIQESFKEHRDNMAKWREQNKKNIAKNRIKIKALVEAHLKDYFVKIPGGRFNMGDDQGAPSEQPLHEVVIEPFYLGKTEVTFELYDLCREDNGCYNHPSDMGWGREDRPVINISHKDIDKRFLPWINKVTGRTYRLPSEAEWEYAARAGTSKNYSWGDNILCSQARFDGGLGSICDTNDENNQGTYKVKSFEPNAFGLYDMHGNVWEWVEDCWTINYNNAPKDGSVQKVGNCNARVLRGGAWDSNKHLLRSASRFYFPKVNRKAKFGFRLARDVE